jgi:hypothetical protein
MSVQHRANGWPRLACDGEWCARKFSPRQHIASAKRLREYAIQYGWLTQPAPQQQPSIPGIDDNARPLRDLCPECRRNPG